MPPENTKRLDALLAPTHGSLRGAEFEGLELSFGAPKALVSGAECNSVPLDEMRLGVSLNAC